MTTTMITPSPSSIAAYAFAQMLADRDNARAAIIDLSTEGFIDIMISELADDDTCLAFNDDDAFFASLHDAEFRNLLESLIATYIL